MSVNNKGFTGHPAEFCSWTLAPADTCFPDGFPGGMIAVGPFCADTGIPGLTDNVEMGRVIDEETTCLKREAGIVYVVVPEATLVAIVRGMVIT